MNNFQYIGLVRWALTIGATYFGVDAIQHGAEIETLISGGVAIFTALWSLYDKTPDKIASQNKKLNGN